MTPIFKRARGSSDGNLWTYAKTIKLIDLFEQHSDLWNVSSKLYVNNKHKMHLREQIADELDVEADEISAKLHNIRCQYNSEVRKLRRDESYVPRWKFYEKMTFLSDHIADVKPRLPLVAETRKSQSAKQVPAKRQQHSRNSSYADANDEMDTDDTSDGSTASSPTTDMMSQRSDRRTEEREEPKFVPKLQIKEAAGPQQMAKTMRIIADSQQIFGDYVADQLRYMSIEKQRRVKLAIQKAIIKSEEERE